MHSVKLIDFLEKSSAAAVVVDPAGRILWCNATWMELVVSDCEGRNFGHFVAPRDASAVVEFGQMLMELGEMHRTLWLITDEGREFLAHCESLLHGEEVLIIVRDVNRPRHHQEFPWPLIEEVAGLGHWRRSAGSDVVQGSTEFFRIFEKEPQSDAVELSEFVRHLVLDEFERVAEIANEAVQDRRSFQLETVIELDDGTIKEIHLRGVPQLNDRGHLIGTIGTVQDVTQANIDRRRKAAQAKINALSTFAAGVTHELNSPLAVIGSNAAFVHEHLAATDPDGDLLGALDDILRNLDRARAIVDKLRPVAHLDTTSPEVIDIAEVMRTAADESGASIHPFAALFIESDDDLPTLSGNRSRLVQALMNVLSNAIEAIRDADIGRGRITMTARNDGAFVAIEITDNGIGIERDVLDQVFDPFYTTREVGKGAGLGLAVLRDVVDEFDGEVSITSEPGETTVSIRLPTVVDLRATPIVLHRPSTDARNSSDPQ